MKRRPRTCAHDTCAERPMFMAVAVINDPDGKAPPTELGGFAAFVCEEHARSAHEMPLCAAYVQRLP